MKREKQLVRFSHLMAGEVVADGTATAGLGTLVAIAERKIAEEPRYDGLFTIGMVKA